MKKIFLAISFILVSLPQVSFGATTFIDPQLAAFNDQQGVESRAFWAQQAAERDAWGAAHKSTLDQLNVYGKALVEYKEKQRQASLGHGAAPLLTSAPVAPPADPGFAAFRAQQQSEKEAFLAKMAQERQQFFASHPGITPN